MGELLKDILPSLLLLSLVNASRYKRYETASPHAGTTGDNIGGKCGTDVVNELSRGIEALAAMTEKTGGIGFAVEVEKECPVDNS